MTETTLVVTNDTGLHSRPADLFVRTARLYRSQITVHKGEHCSDAKNIIKLILLNIPRGTTIRIVAEGDDEKDAISDLQSLVTSDFRVVNDQLTI
jgi:phosphocarrier protein HPr